jgi:hypothetical protein
MPSRQSESHHGYWRSPFTTKAIAKQVGLLSSDNNIELLEDHTSDSK